MLWFSAILIGVVCLLLILAVLAQNSKGGGLAMGMGGATQVIGARRTSDLFEKSTWVLISMLIVACLALTTYVTSHPADASQGEELQIDLPTTPIDGGTQGGEQQQGTSQDSVK